MVFISLTGEVSAASNIFLVLFCVFLEIVVFLKLSAEWRSSSEDDGPQVHVSGGQIFQQIAAVGESFTNHPRRTNHHDPGIDHLSFDC